MGELQKILKIPQELPMASTTIGRQDSKPLLLSEEFPQDVVKEILLRLPVESLLKFRCVSKSWLSLISSPEFIKSHFDTSMKNHQNSCQLLTLSFYGLGSEFMFCSLDSLNASVRNAICIDHPLSSSNDLVWFVGSVNGLVCVASWNSINSYLWNPCTRKYIKLPFLDFEVSHLRRNLFLSHILYGFGYDEFNEDYKVVAIICYEGHYDFYMAQVKVYSQKNDSWKRIGDFPGDVPEQHYGKFVNGKLHWLQAKSLGIVSVDLTNETYGELSVPNFEKFRTRQSVLGNLGASLCVLCDSGGFEADLWVMMEYGVGDSWTKLVTISYAKSQPLYEPPAFCISDDGEVLILFDYVLKLYSLKDGEFLYPKIINFSCCHYGGFYIPSFISPCIKYVEEKLQLSF